MKIPQEKNQLLYEDFVNVFFLIKVFTNFYCVDINLTGIRKTVRTTAFMCINTPMNDAKMTRNTQQEQKLIKL